MDLPTFWYFFKWTKISHGLWNAIYDPKIGLAFALEGILRENAGPTSFFYYLWKMGALLRVIFLNCLAYSVISGPTARHEPEFIDLFNAGVSPKFQVFSADLSSVTGKIGRNDFFQEMSPVHSAAVQEVAALLRGFHFRSDFAEIALQLRDHPELNPSVWIRAVVGTIVHRPDRAHFKIPALIHVEPDNVLSTPVVRELVTRAETGIQECVTVDEKVGADNGIENELWYFREDPMVNSHHWHWHLMFPWNTHRAPDRRGELFYAAHHAMVSRYQAERLSNNLAPVTAFAVDETPVIPTGYNPHLTDLNSHQDWVARPDRQGMTDTIIYNTDKVAMTQVVDWHRNLLRAIDDGYMTSTNGSRISLLNTEGIDILSIALEATLNSVNPELYGMPLGYHNSGHFFLGNSVSRPGEPVPTTAQGVMGGTASAMRDPIFYRWHEHVNNIYRRQKYTLEPYKPESAGEDSLALGWTGVHVESVQIQVPDPEDAIVAPKVNQVFTYWTHTNYDLTNGLDFKRNESETGQGKVEVCVKHLDHEEFSFRIRLRADSRASGSRAALRIFLAPRFDENGVRYPISEQHKLFFPLDAFTVELVKGVTEFSRASADSSTTISFQQGLAEVNEDQKRAKVYCGCGWPGYMLLPKGKADGMAFDLFVMATKEEEEIAIPRYGGHGPVRPVQQEEVVQEEETPLPQSTPIETAAPLATGPQCQEAYLICGKHSGDFPDPKPMLYPFDRRPWTNDADAKQGAYLEDWMAGSTNMAATQVTITHLGLRRSLLQKI